MSVLGRLARRPRDWPLATRLAVGAGAWIAIALPAGALALSIAFREAVVDRFDVKLDALARGLAAGVVADPATGAPRVTAALDPTFRDPEAGWYWRVETAGGTAEARRGPVLAPMARAALDRLDPAPDAIAHADSAGPDGRPYRLAVTAVPVAGTDEPARLAVILPAGDIRAEIATFRAWVVAGAAVFALGLLVAVGLQVGYGLAPMRRLTGDLERIEAGALDRLPEDYPPDITPIARSMNAVIDHERRVVDRARKTAGNLAHALNTELTKLGQESAARGEAAERLGHLIDHHLARASAAAPGLPGARADTAGVVADVAAALGRAFAHRGLAVTARAEGAPAFRGEREDLEEILGNLVENACKHAASAVTVTATADSPGRLRLVVADDGPGLDPAAHAAVLERGTRLDERGPGAGLGLAIVADTVALYEGTLALDRAPAGGLAVTVTLPAAPAASD
ncbi:MAG: sensor histidine kinase [Azospirillaceae bacterium]